MRELIVVGFPGKHRASVVLGQLQSMGLDWVTEVADAVAAYRMDDGRLRLDRSIDLTPREKGWAGGLLGALLAALLVAPFTAGASTAAATGAISASALAGGALGGAAGASEDERWKEQHGITNDFLKQVGDMIQPGDSAVFALITRGDPQGIAERFREYGGAVLKMDSNFIPQQNSRRDDSAH